MNREKILKDLYKKKQNLIIQIRLFESHTAQQTQQNAHTNKSRQSILEAFYITLTNLNKMIRETKDLNKMSTLLNEGIKNENK